MLSQLNCHRSGRTMSPHGALSFSQLITKQRSCWRGTLRRSKSSILKEGKFVSLTGTYLRSNLLGTLIREVLPSQGSVMTICRGITASNSFSKSSSPSTVACTSGTLSVCKNVMYTRRFSPITPSSKALVYLTARNGPVQSTTTVIASKRLKAVR